MDAALSVVIILEMLVLVILADTPGSGATEISTLLQRRLVISTFGLLHENHTYTYKYQRHHQFQSISPVHKTTWPKVQSTLRLAGWCSQKDDRNSRSSRVNTKEICCYHSPRNQLAL